MRQLNTRLSIAALLSFTLFWTACQKESSTKSMENPGLPSSSARLGGLVSDDNKTVALLPTIISAEYLVINHTSSSTNVNTAMRGKPGGGNGGDATPPVVTITSPVNGATVNGTVTVVVSATDNVGVSSVTFSVDGIVKGSLTTAPYNFSWDATTVVDGTHSLTATAKDAKNNSASYAITVAKNTAIIITDPVTTPSSYFLATPPIGNQGNEWTCVPFATTYAARSIEHYYRSGASSFSQTTNIFSPEYIYNQTKIAADCGSGTAITLTLDLMKNKGVAPWATMPYSDANGCTLFPTSTQDAVAAGYKISGYSKILNNDKAAIKNMIALKHPVIASLIIDNYFSNAGPGFIWKTAGIGNIGHCVIICGYDDSKNAYKIMNSWGTGWGDAGFCWIDYNFFPSRAGYYVYVIS